MEPRRHPSSEECDNDAHILGRIQTKDEAALGALYDRYSALLFSLLLRITGERGAAEEILQDVFLTAWRSAATWDPQRGSARAWLITIARHRAIDFLRKRRIRFVPLEREPLSDESSPDEIAVSTLTSAVVRESISSLPSMYRDVLEAVYFSGLTHRKAADLLSIPLGTVKSRLRLAFERLARSFRSRGLGE